MEPPIDPPDEQARLAALKSLELLDSPDEERFDRITRSAQRILDVPIALVTLVDEDRQWFKSCQGLGVRETPRSVSFCGHAILRPDLFVVQDAAADPRFAGNPLVTGSPYIRFYAGAPLTSASGHRVGTLCVISPEPRIFSIDDRAALVDLAMWAEVELNQVELSRALRSRRETTDHLQAVMAAVPNGVATFDHEGRVRSFNAAAEEMFDRPAFTVVGRTFQSLVSDADRRETLPEMLRASVALRGDGSGVVRRELCGRRADGTLFPMEVAVGATTLDGERGYVVAARDITAQRELQRMKDEFVAMVSHELRTPLTSIRGSLGLAASGALGDLPAEVARMIDIAVTNTDRLVRLINDILDLERIESGRVAFAPRRVSPAELVDQAVGGLEGAASAAGVNVRVDAVTTEVEVDPDRIIQAVTNLLSNAVKFSPPGGVVDVSAVVDDGQLVVSVVDRGRGIPADMLGSVFERFEQVDTSDAREKGGTGLGLPIVRGIATQHGGDVSVRSALGEGSTFTFTVPAAVASTMADAAADAGTILMVEDDRDVAEVIGATLRRHGIHVLVATNEDQAIDIALSTRPDLLILDVSLRSGDGFGVIEQLRRHRHMGETPVIVYTVRDLDEHDRRRLQLGPTEFVTKAASGPDVLEQRVLERLRGSS